MAADGTHLSVPSRVALLVKAVDQGFDHKSWHGPILKGSLRGVSASQAAWRPGPVRHNIWEIAVHCAYWKYSVLRRLRPDEELTFPEKGSNWFPRPEPRERGSGDGSQKAWTADLAVLTAFHRKLRAAVAALAEPDLDTVPKGSKTRIEDLVLGIAVHDIYHAGQVQLVKRLRPPSVPP
jgi:hypothetical protein